MSAIMCTFCGKSQVEDIAEWQRRALAAERRLAELELGRVAWEQYCEGRKEAIHLGGKVSLVWESLPPSTRERWVKVAKAILAYRKAEKETECHKP